MKVKMESAEYIPFITAAAGNAYLMLTTKWEKDQGWGTFMSCCQWRGRMAGWCSSATRGRAVSMDLMAVSSILITSTPECQGIYSGHADQMQHADAGDSAPTMQHGRGCTGNRLSRRKHIRQHDLPHGHSLDESKPRFKEADSALWSRNHRIMMLMYRYC